MQWLFRKRNDTAFTAAPLVHDNDTTTYVFQEFWVFGQGPGIQVNALLDPGDMVPPTANVTWVNTYVPVSFNAGNPDTWTENVVTLSYSPDTTLPGTSWTQFFLSDNFFQTSGQIYSTSVPITAAAATARAFRCNVQIGSQQPGRGSAATAAIAEFMTFGAAGCVTPGTAINLSASLSCCGGVAGIGWGGAASAMTYSVYEYVPGLTPTYNLVGQTAGTAFTASIPAREKTNQHIFQIIPTNGCGDGAPTAVTVGPKFAVTSPTCPVYSAGVAATPVYSVPGCTR